MRKTLSVPGLLIAVLMSLTACAAHRGAKTTFHDPNMDFGLIRSVAVMPFDNLTTTAKAGDKVRDVFMTMLQASVDVYVIPPGEVRRGISRVRIEDPTTPTAEDVVNVAQNLSADVVITGTVLEYGETRSGSATGNIITLSVKMLEGQTGRVIWSASATRGGVGAAERLLGGGGQPMNIVTSQAVDDLLDRLFR